VQIVSFELLRNKSMY